MIRPWGFPKTASPSLELPLTAFPLPPSPHDLPFLSPYLSFPLHPSPPPSPLLLLSLPSPSLCSSFLPCPLSLSPCLTSPIFLHLSSFLPLSLPQVFSRGVTAQYPECDAILAGGQNLLQLAYPEATSKAAEPGAEMVESRWPHWSAITEATWVSHYSGQIGQPLQWPHRSAISVVAYVSHSGGHVRQTVHRTTGNSHRLPPSVTPSRASNA